MCQDPFKLIDFIAAAGGYVALHEILEDCLEAYFDEGMSLALDGLDNKEGNGRCVWQTIN